MTEKAMIDRMYEVVNGLKAGCPLVPIEVEAKASKTWAG